MENRVLVLDKNKQPLMPCHPARARELLRQGKAAVYRREPFTLILKERDSGEVQPTQVKIDPGAETTGIAVVMEGQRGKRVVWAAEIRHRGAAVKAKLASRRAQRRSRRSRQTRYRAARFLNRRRAEGWLPPSLLSRLGNVVTWAIRLRRWCPVSNLALESVKFDTQLMQNAEISGVEYQQGERQGYEVRQYLLEKFNHRCAYCGKTAVPLEVEHIIPRSRGGSDRISNLTLACHACNQRKGSQTAAEFGHPQVQSQATTPLKDAAAVNSTRKLVLNKLLALGLPLETGSGGQTKFNRTRQGYPKAHWIDAACVGNSGSDVFLSPNHAPLLITAMGRQRRQMTLVDKYGFPRSKAKTTRLVHGFQTGDLVQALVLSGARQGCYRGRVAVKASGSFTIDGTPDISWRCCIKLQTLDGYAYTKGEAASPVV